jgi:hypothetical protein
MISWVRSAAQVFGRPAARIAAVAALVGVVSLAIGLALAERGIVLAALTCAWLFFAGAAAGGVAVAAAIRIASGRWAGAVLPVAEAASAFFGPALAILALLAVGARVWVPSVSQASLGESVVIAARDVLAGVVLYAVGRRLVRRARAGRDVLRVAVLYVVLYAIVLSLWAMDLVMSLQEGAPSTAIPAYYFMASLLTGLAWVAFQCSAVARLQISAHARHDVGKLLFGMTTFVAYLLWSIFLPTWYANLPDETGLLLARWHGAYRPLSLVVMGAVFVGPFVLLLTEAAKRNRVLLGLASASILLGLSIERFLLVFPSLSTAPGPLGALLALGTAAGVAGVFVLVCGAELSRAAALAAAGP